MKVQKLVSEGRAEILETSLIQTTPAVKEDDKATLRSSLEWVYPTEFEPPPGLEKPLPEAAKEPIDALSKEERDALLLKIGTGFPTAFDVRWVGYISEWDAVADERGEWIDVKLGAERVRRLEDVPQTVLAGHSTGIEQPQFLNWRVASNYAMRDGHYHYLAVYSPAGEDGQIDRTKRVMLFGRALIHPELKTAPAEEEGEGEEKAAMPGGLTVQVEYVKVPHGKVTDLLLDYEPEPGGDDSAIRESVQGLIDAGDAEVVDLALVRTRSGVRGKSDTAHEFRYATEWEPPDYSVKEGSKKGGDREGGEEKETALRGSPTAFDVRDIGLLVQVEPVVTPDRERIEMQLKAEATRLIRMVSHPDGDESKFGVRQPLFHSQIISTSLNISDRGYALAAVMAPPGDEGDEDVARFRTLVFVRASIHGTK